MEKDKADSAAQGTSSWPARVAARRKSGSMKEIIEARRDDAQSMKDLVRNRRVKMSAEARSGAEGATVETAEAGAGQRPVLGMKEFIQARRNVAQRRKASIYAHDPEERAEALAERRTRRRQDDDERTHGIARRHIEEIESRRKGPSR